MRHEGDDEDDAASVASVETHGTVMSDDGEFYDGYSKNVDDEQEIDETIEELTEKRYVHVPRRASLRHRKNACSYLQYYAHPRSERQRELLPWKS